MLASQVALTLASSSWLDTVIGWFHDPTTLLLAMGPWVLWGTLLIVFIESGVLFPVLPGDSLLFTAGLLHERLGLHLPTLIVAVFVAAFLGAQVGYWLGREYGRRLFTDDARFLRTEHLDKAEHYFRSYGGRSVVIGRFIPFVRTFIPLAAGIARYPYPKFLLFNSLGSLLWGVGITYAGAALGGVQFVHDNLSVLILLIVAVSLVPMVAEVLIQRRRARAGGEASGGPAAVDDDASDPAAVAAATTGSSATDPAALAATTGSLTTDPAAPPATPGQGRGHAHGTPTPREALEDVQDVISAGIDSILPADGAARERCDAAE